MPRDAGGMWGEAVGHHETLKNGRKNGACGMRECVKADRRPPSSRASRGGRREEAGKRGGRSEGHLGNGTAGASASEDELYAGKLGS